MSGYAPVGDGQMTAGIDTGAYLFLQQIDMMAFVGN